MKSTYFRQFFVGVLFCASVGLTGCRSQGLVGSDFVQRATKIQPGVAPNHTSQEAGYSIWFPATPEIKPHTPSNPALKQYKSHIAAADSAGIVYLVAPMPILPSQRSKGGEKILDLVAAEALKPMALTVMKSTDIMVGDCPGRELHGDINATVLAGRSQIARLIYSGPFCFQISVIGTKPDLITQKATIDQFLDSFRVLDSQ